MQTHGNVFLRPLTVALRFLAGIAIAWPALGAHAQPTPASVVQSSASTRFATQPSLSWRSDDGSGLPTVAVYAGTQQQQIEGFGGAFTESTACVLKRLGPAKRSEVLTKLFSPSDGIGFSLTRTHINSNDFSTHHYSYDDHVDPQLADFSIADDLEDLVPLIRDASNVPNASFKLLASPWSAPAWMKGTDEIVDHGTLLDKYRSTWAQYISKYLAAYAAQGIQLWGITAQNEPQYAAAWESMTVPDLTGFIRDHLGPTLRRDGFGNVKIFSGDDQKDQVRVFADSAFNDPAASEFIWGIATHWYVTDQFEQLEETFLHYPEKKLLGTEAAIFPGTYLKDWNNAQDYAHDIIGDINHGAVGWIDWNMALDSQGGPNPPDISNPCSAPVIVTGGVGTPTASDDYCPTSGDGTYELNTQYFALGHFSKYVHPPAKKVGNMVSDNVHIEASAFENPDHEIVVVVYNADTKQTQIKLKDGDAIVTPWLPAGSITTFRYQNSNRAVYPTPELIALRASNGLYVTQNATALTPTSASALTPTSSTIGNAQRFILYYKPDGFVTLRSLLNQGYASVGTADKLAASSSVASAQIVPPTIKPYKYKRNPYVSFERFQLVTNTDGSISFKALKNGKYVQAALGSGQLQATSSSIGAWEKFSKVSGGL